MSIPSPSVLMGGQQHTVSIEKVAHGGAGLAMIDVIPVFVQTAIPGQKVEIVITKRRDRYAEAKVIKVLQRAKDEVPARCPHFAECGGCSWQNLPYNKQLSYKEDI